MHKGFSVIEAAEACFTTHGRKNRKKYGPSNLDMLKWQRDHAVSIEKAAGMSEEELQDKIVTGVLHNVDKPEFTEQYQKLIDSFGGGAK